MPCRRCPLQAPAPWGSLGAAVPLAAVAVVGALVAAVWRMVSRPVAQTPVDPIDLLRPADRLATWTAGASPLLSPAPTLTAGGGGPLPPPPAGAVPHPERAKRTSGIKGPPDH